MISQLNISLLGIMLCCLWVSNTSGAEMKEVQYPGVKIEQVRFIQESIVEEEKESGEEIALKQREMRDTIVFVKAHLSNSSGTIIDCVETDTKNVFEYRVLTNLHAIHSRFVEYLLGVDAITGKVKSETVDTGCVIITFDHKNEKWYHHKAEVVAENIIYDLAILSFVSSEKLSVAKIAHAEMLKQIRVFDDVFAVGCQLSQAPIPTTGIISQIITGTHGNKKGIVYSNTAQTTPGSSGGGLFKKYDDHYYLIGIPYRVMITKSGQIIPHMSYSISVETAREFINMNLVIGQ